ncbi:cytochrome P450 [Streptomyces sp. NPDC050738]|uniref:cytochrome P450 n=1 Tax=Streptomyces sp. NPDC050738 TaxID=3154744 RepID=UPI0034426AEC
MHEAYEQDRLGFLLATVREHGPVVELSPGTVLVADPEAVHEVLKRTNTDFLMTQNRQKRSTAGHRGEAELDSWMTTRRATLSALAGEAVDAHLDWYATQVGALVDAWKRRGTVDDALPELTDLSTLAFAQLCLGRDDPELRSLVTALQLALLPIVGSNLRLPAPLAALSPTRRRAVRAQRDLTELLHRRVAEPSAGGLAHTLRSAGVPADPLVRMLTSMALASRLVSAAAISWIIAGLGDPGGQNGDGPLTATEVAHAVDESLRLWPPTWMLFRETDREQLCASWRIPADAAVMVSPYVSHRDPAVYADPLRYAPDRWEDLSPGPGAYLPFGGGSRWCLGGRLGKAQLLTAASVINREAVITTTTAPSTPNVRSSMIPDHFSFHVVARPSRSS